MAYAALFMIAAALEIAAATLIFLFKDVLHTVLALSFVFIMNSAVFLILSQPFLALIQLFIMVGGVATYAFVGVSSASYSKFSHTNYKALAITYVVLFALFAYKALQSSPIINEQNTLSGAVISQSLGSSMPLLYLIAVMLFGIGFGSIVLMRKLSGKR